MGLSQGGGGGGATPPTGTGFVTVTSGAQDAASLAFPLAVNKGGTGLSALGSALQVLRTNAGVTAAEWATISGSVAGSDTQVQFNDGGSMGADAGLTFNKTTDVLGVGVAVKIGATPAGIGALRLTFGEAIASKTNGGSDTEILKLHTSNHLTVGDATNVGLVVISTGSGGSVVLRPGGGSDAMRATTTEVGFFRPVAGYSEPFKFKRATVTISGNVTLSSAQYECPFIDLNGAYGFAFDVIAPNIAGSTFNIKNVDNFDTATIKKSGGTGFGIAAGARAWAHHNGTDYENRS